MADAWKPYIDNMTASGLQIAGIFGMNGQPYSMSPSLGANQQEMAALVQSMKSNNFSNGVVLGGKKYTVIRGGDDQVTAKCRTAEKEEEKYLLHVATTNTLVIVGGICGANERNTTTLVENIVDYLKKANY